ncbi:hypothetical protein NMY22_g10656 [Coprinellus aureogranulatus]|nr:hypothetical protein NMY22_g10656 [Coprinellus aureogranulatus]
MLGNTITLLLLIANATHSTSYLSSDALLTLIPARSRDEDLFCLVYADAGLLPQSLATRSNRSPRLVLTASIYLAWLEFPGSFPQASTPSIQPYLIDALPPSIGSALDTLTRASLWRRNLRLVLRDPRCNPSLTPSTTCTLVSSSILRLLPFLVGLGALTGWYNGTACQVATAEKKQTLFELYILNADGRSSVRAACGLSCMPRPRLGVFDLIEIVGVRFPFAIPHRPPSPSTTRCVSSVSAFRFSIALAPLTPRLVVQGVMIDSPTTVPRFA